jgi:ribosomal protein L11 methylase PrmA
LEEQGSMTADHPMWEDFARGMASIMRPAAADIARIVGIAEMGACKILDVAAGHGIFGITLAEQNSQAEVYAVDWQNVLAIAQRNAEAAGVAERFHRIPGSAFEVEFGTGYDLVLLTNFFALVMLGTTPTGDAYTFSEFERMFQSAGFSRSESHQTMPGHIIVSYKE